MSDLTSTTTARSIHPTSWKPPSAGDAMPAVIATMSYSGLALARSLGRRGVPVVALATAGDELGMSSRFVQPWVSPDLIQSEQHTVEVLLEVAEWIGRRAALFATGDALLLPISHHREQLAKHFEFHIPPPQLVDALVSKRGLVEVLQAQGIDGPATYAAGDQQELDALLPRLRFPVLIKPEFSASWYTDEMVNQIGVRKVVLVYSAEALLHWYTRIARVDPRVVLQEFIPGEDARLFYVCGYFDQNSRPVAMFAGRKDRVIPIHLGSASFVVSCRDPRLETLTERLLQPLGYQGLFGVEYKLDPRDGEFKVIEVNARWGLWDGLSRRCGLDLGYLAYTRLTGQPFRIPTEYRTGVRWLAFRRDFDAFLDYRREGSLSTWAWIRSLLGPTEFACWSWDDPRPFLTELKKRLFEVGRAIRRRVVPKDA